MHLGIITNINRTKSNRFLVPFSIRHYGFPEECLYDQGRNFESELISELCRLAQIKKAHTTPYHPMTNGQCERFNSTLCNMLGTLSEHDKINWKNTFEFNDSCLQLHSTP